MAGTNNPWQAPIKYGIVNARGTDGYSIVNEYADGSQSGAWGWFSSFESAEREVEASDVPVEDWTTDEDAE